MSTPIEEFKARQKAVWSAGSYETMSPFIADVGEGVVARAGAGPGIRLLDVACGAGNAALPAARAGADVTGLDLTTRLIEAGRAKAEAEGLTIEWRQGDAEALPFEDARFDRVVSTFGHMFAPRHQQTADEMARVCRPGGTIVTATWVPDGVVGELFAVSGSFMPPPPADAQPPVWWGKEDYVRDRFAAVASDFSFERLVNTVEWESVDSFADFFMGNFPPMVMARTMLGDRFDELRQAVIGVWSRANQATDGSLRLPQEYLVSIVRL